MKKLIAITALALFATTGLASASTAQQRADSHRGVTQQTAHHAGDNDMDKYHVQYEN